ncbi:Phosphohydrolase [Bacillus sp. 349Y]|nr:Phosphohydrolase [Bacillus sp. 349Y]
MSLPLLFLQMVRGNWYNGVKGVRVLDKLELMEEMRRTYGLDPGGHDWHHLERVRRLALYIAEEDHMGDRDVIEWAAILHDVADEKLNPTPAEGTRKLEGWLRQLPVTTETSETIREVIHAMGFKGGSTDDPVLPEAKVLRDADRLDAMGAIGISRVFAYGGWKGQPIHLPDLPIREQMTNDEYRNGLSTSINHFHEKLFKLKDRMLTPTGKRLAEERHAVMKDFIRQFTIEWNGPQ